jgi:protein-disulfide isomerase
MVDESGGEVSMIVRHYPLDSHPAAEKWARAAECVAKQGGGEAFFSFFDQLYSGEGAFNESKATDFLRANSLDEGQYDDCMNSEAVAQWIQEDMSEGQALGVNGTPAMVIYNASNGKAVFEMGAMPRDQMQRLVDQVK